MTKKMPPSLFGIKNSNRDYTRQETWGKNMFNSSFPAALVAYMYSKKLKSVYIKTDKRNQIEHSKISTEELFGIPPLDKNTFYAFAYVWNKDCEWCSEFGTIGVKSFGGGLKRIY